MAWGGEIAAFRSNPFSDKLTVDLFTEAASPARVDVMNANGTAETSFTADLRSGLNSISLKQAGDLNKGIYLIRITTQKDIHILKIIKE